MATKDETHTSALPEFSALKAPERRAVILRSEGKINEQVTAHINSEFALTYSEATVREWFGAGGKLEQAFAEYNEALAAASLRDARQIIKKGSRSAAATLLSKLSSHDERVALDAAKALLNKYVPDKQIVSDSLIGDEELPSALADIGDALIKGETDGQEPVDDAPEGPGAGGSDGSAGSQDVSAGVLPESPATDKPSA